MGVTTHPAPEVPARDAHEKEIPRGAKAVRKLAEANGWKVRAMYAKGTTMDRYGRPGEVVESLSLRMRRGSSYVAAVWVEGKFSKAWHVVRGAGIFRGNSDDMRVWLTREPA